MKKTIVRFYYWLKYRRRAWMLVRRLRKSYRVPNNVLIETPDNLSAELWLNLQIAVAVDPETDRFLIYDEEANKRLDNTPSDIREPDQSEEETADASREITDVGPEAANWAQNLANQMRLYEIVSPARLLEMFEEKIDSPSSEEENYRHKALFPDQIDSR